MTKVMLGSGATRSRNFAMPVALVLALVGASACGRTPEAKPDTPASSATASTAAAARADASPLTPQSSLLTTSFRLPNSARLVAIGDIHGDLAALRGALRLAGAIDTDDKWIGRNLTVVQTGDQVDRGDQDREVLDLLEKLEADAKSAGGALYVLNGNHELMNASFDFRYVTRKSFATFDEFRSRAGELAARVPDAERGRAAAFMPGAPYALKLSRHLTIAQVGDSVFAHAGVTPAHIDYGLDRINREASAFLSGKLRELPTILSAEDGPVWTRAFGSPVVEDAVCQSLGQALQQLGAKRLIVGHTVQERGISSACQERLFRIDIGLSAYYGDKPPQVLEVTAAGARVLGPDTAGAPAKNGKVRDSALHSDP
jgi:hypothetical protein